MGDQEKIAFVSRYIAQTTGVPEASLRIVAGSAPSKIGAHLRVRDRRVTWGGYIVEGPLDTIYALAKTSKLLRGVPKIYNDRAYAETPLTIGASVLKTSIPRIV